MELTHQWDFQTIPGYTRNVVALRRRGCQPAKHFVSKRHGDTPRRAFPRNQHILQTPTSSEDHTYPLTPANGSRPSVQGDTSEHRAITSEPGNHATPDFRPPNGDPIRTTAMDMANRKTKRFKATSAITCSLNQRAFPSPLLREQTCYGVHIRHSEYIILSDATCSPATTPAPARATQTSDRRLLGQRHFAHTCA